MGEKLNEFDESGEIDCVNWEIDHENSVNSNERS